MLLQTLFDWPHIHPYFLTVLHLSLGLVALVYLVTEQPLHMTSISFESKPLSDEFDKRVGFMILLQLSTGACHNIFQLLVCKNNKWKNHFYEMKGDVGMSLHEKERNKKMPTPRHLITPSLHLCFFQDYNVHFHAGNLRREKNDRLVSVHISIDSGDVW